MAMSYILTRQILWIWRIIVTRKKNFFLTFVPLIIIKISNDLISKLQEFENFINDKTDCKAGAPIKYLRDTKQALWEKFHAEFPDGIRRTTFMTKLQENEYIHREDLDGGRYGYEVFDDIRKLIENIIIDIIKKITHQVRLGLDIKEGADIETVMRDIRGTSVAHLEPNQTKNIPEERESRYYIINGLVLEIMNPIYDFPLVSRWELKSKQKYGKKGGEKSIPKRMYALENLKSKVEEGELEDDKIPKLQTIQGWISRYSAQHRQKMAEMSVEASSS
ncbi:hypothetical protein C1646_805969 [Rhizophagus diaphanus]|nr:hypothetical protein C1646_805969 [Rhizophagus diaphanus] [Rhizophagus sp. MUCL 43196]